MVKDAAAVHSLIVWYYLFLKYVIYLMLIHVRVYFPSNSIDLQEWLQNAKEEDVLDHI